MKEENISLKIKIQNQLNQWFAKLYLGNAPTIITMCWIVSSFHLTITYKYQNCISCYDIKDTFLWIFWLALVIIFICFVPIVIYFYKNKERIGKEKINSLEEKNSYFGFADRNPKVFILPMYLLMIFALSKLIVISYDAFKDGSGEDTIIKVVILSIIFLSSLWAWCRFKKTSSKTWSFWVTVFAISYVFVNIYWKYFLPFLESYIKTWNCIFKLLVE